MTNKLAFKPKELGPQILEAAQELRKQQFSGEVIKQVTRWLHDRQIQEQQKILADMSIKAIDMKIEAIDKGRFILDAFGKITFIDKKLNEV